MTNQSTMDKLIEMRLTTMADAFRNQLNDPKFKEVPFEDQFGMLVDIEYSSRKNNRLKRLIKNAGFDQPEANIMDINYTSGRKLNKELIRRLADVYKRQPLAELCRYTHALYFLHLLMDKTQPSYFHQYINDRCV